MQNKKDAIKRLIIYIVLAFVISNGPMLVMMALGVEQHTPTYRLVALLTMCGPAVASLLTRVITKEGFHNMYLRVNLKGNEKNYILAVLLPVVCAVLGGLLSALCFGGFLQNEALKELSPVFYGSYVLYLVGFSAAVFFPAMGEELGWRGYMTPKMEEIMGTPAALLIGGVIWGLWHISNIIYSCQGQGVAVILVQTLLKCVVCVGMGSILTYFTKKTGSIYPGSLLHMVNNNVAQILYVPFMTTAIMKAHNLEISILILIPIVVIGAVTFILQVRDGKKKTPLPVMQ